MKKFYVPAKAVDYFYAVVEANNEDEAYNKAEELAWGGAMETIGDGDFDINFSGIREITDEEIKEEGLRK